MKASTCILGHAKDIIIIITIIIIVIIITTIIISLWYSVNPASSSRRLTNSTKNKNKRSQNSLTERNTKGNKQVHLQKQIDMISRNFRQGGGGEEMLQQKYF